MIYCTKEGDAIQRDKNILQLLIFFCLGCLLVMVAGGRPPGLDPDYWSYFFTLKMHPAEYNYFEFEPFYYLAVYFSSYVFDIGAQGLFYVIAIVFVVFSLMAIWKYSERPFFSVLIFILLFYPNFALIQIRNGVALSILIFAFYDFSADRKKDAFIKMILATLWHYSSVVFLLVYLLDLKNIKIFFYAFLPVIGYFVGQYFFSVSLLEKILSVLNSEYFYKLINYVDISRNESISSLMEINLINFYTLFILCLYYLGLYIYSFYRTSPSYTLFLKVLGWGIFSWFALSALPVLSFRFSNSAYFFLIFLLPLYIKYFPVFYRLVIVFCFVCLTFLNAYNIYARHKLFDFSVLGGYF